MANIYLEKIALSTATIKKYPKAIGGALLGGYVGAASGASKTKYDRNFHEVKKSKTERVLKGIGGGVAGAFLGANIFGGDEIAKGIADKAYKKYGYSRGGGSSGGGGGGRSWGGGGPSMNSIMRDLEHPGFKTKAEATKHYKRMAMRYHPDRPQGDQEKMKKLNAAWKHFKEHPQGFEKLAMLNNPYLTKFASLAASLVPEPNSADAKLRVMPPLNTIKNLTPSAQKLKNGVVTKLDSYTAKGMKL